MTALNSYSTGTVSVNNGDAAIVGTGTIWSGTNAKAGDVILVDGDPVEIKDVTDVTHLSLWTPWTGGAKSGASYVIIQKSPLRFAGSQAMADVNTLIAALNTTGFFVFVGATETVPDPSLGEDGQFAFQAGTGKLWVKDSGIWNFLGIYKGFNLRGAYDAGTTYSDNDVVTLNGSSYAWINAASGSGHSPPDGTFWQLLAGKGDTGSTGPTGASYGGTSTTSLTIGTGSKAFTTQAGLAYQNGARVRASSAANTSNWMEGLAAYSGTTLTITADKTGGSGTHADWNFNVVGEPAAGDLISTNNLSDLTNANSAQKNLGLPAIMRNYIADLTLSTAGSSTTFSVAAGVAADSTNADMMTLASSISKTTGAWAVGSGNGALDTGSIANNTWYHAYLIKRIDTQVVDVLISTSATSPTLPTNYTIARRIGSMKTNGSGQWIKFIQDGDRFMWDAPVSELTTSGSNNPGTSAITQTLTGMPPGVRNRALLSWALQANATTGPLALYVSDLSLSDQTPNGGLTWTGQVFVSPNSANFVLGSTCEVMTNTSQQIRWRIQVSASGSIVYLSTLGWVDRR